MNGEVWKKSDSQWTAMVYEIIAMVNVSLGKFKLTFL